MCGIAGLIHKGKTVNIGYELQNMLQESSKIKAKDTDKKRSRYFLENFQL